MPNVTSPTQPLPAMPTYRVPVSFYVQSVSLATAIGQVDEYLSADLSENDLFGIVGVDIEAHQAEPVPDAVPEPEPTH